MCNASNLQIYIFKFSINAGIVLFMGNLKIQMMESYNQYELSKIYLTNSCY